VSPPNGTDNAQSGVQLSRQALYEQRVDEIYEDAQAGRCSFEEAVERIVEATSARMGGNWFTPSGLEELKRRVRVACESDPRLLLRKESGR
jgi:hypothetical protein